MSADLEARLLASLPSVEEFERLAERGIYPELFLHHRPIYQYIEDVVREHRHLPRLRDIQATFNIPAWVERKPQEFDWLCGEFKRLTTALRVQELVEAAVEEEGDDPDALVNTLINNLSGIAAASGRQISITDQSAVRRFAAYAEHAPPEGAVAGLPTGLSYFDAELGLGWLPGELIGVVARTYMGKSWMLMYFGIRAWQMNRRVLFLTPELTIEEAEARFDGLVCGINGVDVRVTELYRGFYPTEAQQALAAEMARRSSWTTISSSSERSFGLRDIPRMVREHKPDLLLVDGLPHMLMQANKRDATWEKILEISYGLKDCATGLGIPIIVAHQANRAAGNTSRPPGLAEIMGGDGFAQACDRVVVMSQPASRPMEMKLTIQKFRKGKPIQGGILLDWDPDRGVIRERVDQGGTDGAGGDRPRDEAGEGAEAPMSIP